MICLLMITTLLTLLTKTVLAYSISSNFQEILFCYPQSLFRNFGQTFLAIMKPHVERLIADTSHDKHHQSQRCAMEVLAGIIMGSKYWTFTQVCTHAPRGKHIFVKKKNPVSGAVTYDRSTPYFRFICWLTNILSVCKDTN